MDFTKLKKSRAAVRRIFTKTCNDIETIAQNDVSRPDDITRAKALLEVLDQHYVNLKKDDSSIYELLLNQEKVKDEEIDEELNSQQDYSLKYQVVKKSVETLLFTKDDQVSLKSSQVTSSSKQVNLNSSSYKLPLLKFKEFSGDLKDWLPFWSQFKKIDQDDNLDMSDKFQYLVMATTPNSPAREVVESYPATAEMYTEALKALKSRFGREDLLTEYYIREMLKIILENASLTKKPLISMLYDKLQCHLRNLETLGVSADTCAPILLPLVSSCLPEDVLKLWERSSCMSSKDGDCSSKLLLENLMNFLKKEIEGEQKIALAVSGFSMQSHFSKPLDKGKKKDQKASQFCSNTGPLATAADLVTTIKNNKTLGCIFCSYNNHKPQDCIKAQSMSIDERRSLVKDTRSCFCCLKPGHSAQKCKNKPKCILCKRPHFVIMCDSLTRKESNKGMSDQLPQEVPSAKSDEALANFNPCNVLMQTLRVNVKGPNGVKSVRALIDSASQRSYMLSNTATELGYLPCRQESIQHSLFGGMSTNVIHHKVYVAYLSSLDYNYSCHFEVLAQPKICGKISSVVEGPWIQQLEGYNIKLSDFESDGPIELLIGADVAGKLWTGGRKVLDCGLVSMETKLGWTLMGRLSEPHESNKNLALLVTTMLCTEAKITDLWRLDTLGILDPSEKVTKAELEAATHRYFLETVELTEDNRFEVRLPWINSHPPLADNYKLASKRLNSTLKKLNTEGLYDKYQTVFDEWLEDGVIEEVPDSEINLSAHYLPHHPVVKPNSTTPVRPVFDASAHENHSPSLNQCLEKGPNLIEKIPSIIHRFRLKRVGIISDIRRAFLQISLNSKDRDFLRFLWKNKRGEMKIYRHCRVVFGVSSSPFLLEASIKLHLEQTISLINAGKANWPIELVKTLASSFYVDNSICSLKDKEEAESFIQTSTEVMSLRQFDLRGWELPDENATDPSNVLGLLWNRHTDTIEVNLTSFKDFDREKVTKRRILSAAHQVFDPIGFTSPVTLIPKLLLQETWEKNLGWDQEVDEDTKTKFLKWLKDINFLSFVKIPRWLPGTNLQDNWTLHFFSDACQKSYASVVYLRVELSTHVRVQLVTAKSKVSPVNKMSKKMTIPRLELLAASISARLHSTVTNEFGIHKVKCYFWTDATTVLAWIKRKDCWDVFVQNRVTEIKNLTAYHEWRHVPGNVNPADLPSRGCSARKLLETRWWEGPQWLLEPPELWPKAEVCYNEEEIGVERKKSVVSALVNDQNNCAWIFDTFSSYKRTLRFLAWIYRFIHNSKLKFSERIVGELSVSEIEFAENKIVLLVQEQEFSDVLDPRLKSLIPFVDKNGIIRLTTKISNRSDLYDFCYPIVLPSSDHPIVFKLIMELHVDNCHSGTQMMMTIIRQKFWILGGRRTVRRVLDRCVRCKRHSAKKIESVPTPLPLDRVKNAKVFEVTGVDLAGPLHLKSETGNTKAWVCLFTCGIYRAVHLELLSSLSTDCFLLGLRKFTSRRGRPSVMYSDSGTNFTGTVNAFRKLDWSVIEQYSSVRKIQWKFSPPSGPWWGGFWERLIGILKKLLRRVLGNTSVNFEEMQTLLCDCEAIINSRPLTYVSEDPQDLTPLTPSMFLQDIEEVGMPDCDLVEASDLNKRLKYRQKLKQDLLCRFRTEYLGQLQLHSKKVDGRKISVGDIVLIGSDNVKRMNWPLGRIVELIKGKDDNIRLARLQTAKGNILRPVQRLFPLEINSNIKENETGEHLRNVTKSDKLRSTDLKDEKNLPEEEQLSTASTVTKSGRAVHKPNRLNL